jgi:histidine decarboxylase
MNWLGRMVGLPDDFLHLRSDSPGGGVIQVSAAARLTDIALLCFK